MHDNITSRATLSLAVIALAAGCALDATPANDLSLETGGGPSGYVGSQGQLVLGFKNSAINWFQLPGETHVHVDPTGQVISDQHSGTEITKVAVLANGTIPMRITSATPPSAPGQKWQYHLQQLNGSIWEDACDNPLPIMPPPYVDPNPLDAIALNGLFDATGKYYTAAPVISFSCHAGVVTKCDTWGYPVDAKWPTTTVNHNNISVTGADMLQACTRMARADYCGVGLTNTLPGTRIHFEDIYDDPPDDPGYSFEAAWQGHAVGSTQQNLPDTAICLTKKRWSTLPIGGNCMGLPDPRLNGASGFFCDDGTHTMSQLELLGARTYSSSAFIDAGLWNYYIDASKRRLATTYLQPQKGGAPPQWTDLLDPQVGFPPTPPNTMTFNLEATIFNVNFRNIPKDAMPLSSYNCKIGGLITTTASSTCTKIATEGFVYPDHTTGRAQMRRWIEPSGVSFTTTASPASMIAQGDTLAELTGSVIRGQHAVNVRWSYVFGATYQVQVRTRLVGWTPCSTQLTTPSFAFSGQCAATPMKVDRNDVTGFRVTATVGSQTYTADLDYDGIATDVHLDIASFLPSALEIHWSSLGTGYVYAITIDGRKCFDTSIVGADLSRVAMTRCPSLNQALTIGTIHDVTVCGTLGGVSRCGSVVYDGHASSLAVPIP